MQTAGPQLHIASGVSLMRPAQDPYPSALSHPSSATPQVIADHGLQSRVLLEGAVPHERARDFMVRGRGGGQEDG